MHRRISASLPRITWLSWASVAPSQARGCGLGGRDAGVGNLAVRLQRSFTPRITVRPLDASQLGGRAGRARRASSCSRRRSRAWLTSAGALRMNSALPSLARDLASSFCARSCSFVKRARSAARSSLRPLSGTWISSSPSSVVAQTCDFDARLPGCDLRHVAEAVDEAASGGEAHRVGGGGIAHVDALEALGMGHVVLAADLAQAQDHRRSAVDVALPRRHRPGNPRCAGRAAA